MFLLYFLDAYVNMVKYLERVQLDVSMNWHCLHQDAGKTWIICIGHNATRHHNFNTLPQALPHALQYIFSQFSMIWGTFYNGLPRVTVNLF